MFRALVRGGSHVSEINDLGAEVVDVNELGFSCYYLFEYYPFWLALF